MRKFSIISLIFLVSMTTVFAQARKCNCLSASKKDVPSLGNQLIVIDEKKVKQVRGIITWLDGTPMNNAVIEVFKTSQSEIDKKVSYNGYSNDPDIARDHKIYDIAQDKKRRAACKTGNNGRFCLKRLSEGVYILRVGLNQLVDKSGMNAEYFVVEIDGKNGTDKEIEIVINAAG